MVARILFVHALLAIAATSKWDITTKKMPISDQEFMTDPKSPLKKSYLWWQNKALANTW